MPCITPEQSLLMYMPLLACCCIAVGHKRSPWSLTLDVVVGEPLVSGMLAQVGGRVQKNTFVQTVMFRAWAAAG
jgi:hypothetical protein